MIDLRKLKPIPHPTKLIFRRHGIPLSSICTATNRSYSYVSSVLSGIRQATPELDVTLRKLAKSLEHEVT